MISIPGGEALFTSVLFAAAADGTLGQGAEAVHVALCRMYASALLCFAIGQHMLWREYRAACSSANEEAVIAANARLRTWAVLMLLPDLHHLLYAYGPYAFASPFGRADVACIVHHVIQLVLILGRIVLIAASTAGSKTGTGAIGSALQGALDFLLSSKVDRSLPSDLRLEGVTIGVTGASRGLGHAIAHSLARRGANVVVLNRSLVDETVASLKAEPGARPAGIRGVQVDLESVASVDAAVAHLEAGGFALHRIVLNAGMLPIQSRPSTDGVDVMLQTNFLSAARLVDQLLAKKVLVAGAGAGSGTLPRVIVVGSEAHRSSHPLDLADLDEGTPLWEYGVSGVVKMYGHTKLYLHTWACTLSRKLAGQADVLHLCPGAVATEIGREAPDWAKPLLRTFMKLAFQSPVTAAAPAVWCAAHPDAAGRNGLYLHLGKERLPSSMAMDETVGNALWDKAHKLLQRLEKKAK